MNKKVFASYFLVFPTVTLLSDMVFEYISKDITVILLLCFFCIGAAIFHIIWTWYMAISKKTVGIEAVVFSAIGKLMFVPIYLLIIAYGIGFLSAGAVFDLLEVSESLRAATPLITAIMIVFIFILMTSSQFVGILKMFENDELTLVEAVLFLVLSWVYIADICVAVAASIKHKRVKAATKRSDMLP